MVPTEVPGCGGEGRVDDTVPGRFDVAERGANVEEQWGVGVEAHAEDAEEGV
jgi:hypothetical protein